MIGIINTGFGNIRSISNIYFEKNIKTKFINNKNDFYDVNKIILPGIGKFDSLVNKLNNMQILEHLNNFVLDDKKQILGICIGMHVFYESSAEGELKGLGWIKGKIEKLDADKTRLPHMGWNKIFNLSGGKLFKEISEGSSFYFLHSYGNKVDAEINFNHCTFTNHGHNFTSSFEKNNIFGVQFHPEKSLNNGIKLLQNFACLDG